MVQLRQETPFERVFGIGPVMAKCQGIILAEYVIEINV